MTNEEALGLIDECICRGEVVENALSFEFWEKIRRSMKKQIPKKPNAHPDDEYREGFCYFCPSCNMSLATNDDDTWYNWWPDCCMACGQAIDWSKDD